VLQSSKQGGHAPQAPSTLRALAPVWGIMAKPRVTKQGLLSGGSTSTSLFHFGACVVRAVEAAVLRCRWTCFAFSVVSAPKAINARVSRLSASRPPSMATCISSGVRASSSASENPPVGGTVGCGSTTSVVGCGSTASGAAPAQTPSCAYDIQRNAFTEHTSFALIFRAVPRKPSFRKTNAGSRKLADQEVTAIASTAKNL